MTKLSNLLAFRLLIILLAIYGWGGVQLLRFFGYLIRHYTKNMQPLIFAKGEKQSKGMLFFDLGKMDSENIHLTNCVSNK